MGLDITYYSNVKKLDVVFDANQEPIDPVTREPVEYDFVAFVNDNFPGRADDICDRGVYLSEDSGGFRAGSYGGYNQWRDNLAQLAGYPLGEYEQYGRKWPTYCAAAWAGESGPFSEIINFSDCEGTIGATVSAKLAKDFAEYQSKADTFGDEYFREKYAAWRKAFEMAAQGGCVRFH